MKVWIKGGLWGILILFIIPFLIATILSISLPQDHLRSIYSNGILGIFLTIITFPMLISMFVGPLAYIILPIIAFIIGASIFLIVAKINSR